MIVCGKEGEAESGRDCGAGLPVLDGEITFADEGGNVGVNCGSRAGFRPCLFREFADGGRETMLGKMVRDFKQDRFLLRSWSPEVRKVVPLGLD